MRGIPTTIDATTIPTAIPEIVHDQTNQGATAATAYKKNSIASLMLPGVGTTTLFLSFGVEKTDGRPTSKMSVGRTSHVDHSDAAHGPASQAISSDKNRRPEDTGVSCGW